jgi:hypothetical protein
VGEINISGYNALLLTPKQMENGSIRKNSLFRKEVHLSEIRTIEKYAGNYILKTDTKKLTIDTTIIAPNSLAELNAALEKLAI